MGIWGIYGVIKGSLDVIWDDLVVVLFVTWAVGGCDLRDLAAIRRDLGGILGEMV